jgi:predicted nucleotide-binding protein
MADLLIKDRLDFRKDITERLKIGKEIRERKVEGDLQFQNFKSDFIKWNDYNIEYLKHVFNNEDNSYKLAYSTVYSWRFAWLKTFINSEQYNILIAELDNKILNLETLINKADLLKSFEKSELQSDKESNNENDKNIFIVHGHNTEILESVARLIEKIDLFPIILNEMPNEGKTIIEKFEKYTNVNFAIIILADDDFGKSKLDGEMNDRARQNVILELGYFIGKLGRERVLPLYLENVELPSDIHGLLYVPIDKLNNWRYSVVKELKHSGYKIDANKLLE